MLFPARAPALSTPSASGGILSPMRVTFSATAISLIRFAQVAAETLAGALAPRLGLGRFGFTAFLPAPTHQAIAAELTFIEAMVRRALFLIAALRGALPAQASAPKAPSASANKSALPGRAGQVRAPLFSLGEPAARAPVRRKMDHPSTAHSGMGAAAGPPPEEILLPVARLARRLRALDTVFLDPEAHILRMRRRLASGSQKILSRHGFETAGAAADNAVNYRLLGSVQSLVDGALLQMRLDTG